MPCDLRRTIAKLLPLLQELDAELAERSGPESGAGEAADEDAEARYIAEQAERQLARLRARLPRSARMPRAGNGKARTATDGAAPKERLG